MMLLLPRISMSGMRLGSEPNWMLSAILKDGSRVFKLCTEREESELTKRLLEENGLPNLAQVFTQRRYVRKDNLAISNSYFALLKEKGFFNN